MTNAEGHPGRVSHDTAMLFRSSSAKMRVTGLATAREVGREAVVVIKALKMPATRSRCSCLLTHRHGFRARANLLWPVLFAAAFFFVLFFLRD